MYLHLAMGSWGSRSWGHIDGLGSEGEGLLTCRVYWSVPGPLQTVERAEFWEVILALQAADAVHLGVDNLDVVRHVGRLIDGNLNSSPVELLNDGDVILLIDRMLQRRGRDTVCIAKIKGHADEGMVRGRFGSLIGLAIMLRMRLLILGGVGLVRLCLMLGATFPMSAIADVG